MEKIRVPDIVAKKGKEKITALTAYDYTFAKILDKGDVDIVLVGDSAANVISGYSTTLPMDMEKMLFITEGVARGVKRALLVADMPFLSYQLSLEEAMENAGLFLKKGAEAVKVEGGGKDILKKIEAMVEHGIPVMGHLGLTPQSIHKYGGYRLRGKEKAEESELIKSAKALESAGCFSIVLEKITSSLAKKITKQVKIPTVGIGAGPYCDGQILVLYDLLGLDPEFSPKYVKKYANLHDVTLNAIKNFVREVKEGTFPSIKESFE